MNGSSVVNSSPTVEQQPLGAGISVPSAGGNILSKTFTLLNAQLVFIDFWFNWIPQAVNLHPFDVILKDGSTVLNQSNGETPTVQNNDTGTNVYIRGGGWFQLAAGSHTISVVGQANGVVANMTVNGGFLAIAHWLT
jgi:hypothetical protein